MTDHFPGATKMVPKALWLADALEFPDEEELEQAANELRRLHAENEALRIERDANKRYGEILGNTLENLRAAIRKLHAAKGRYHTQLACCDLFDLVGLPNERPKK